MGQSVFTGPVISAGGFAGAPAGGMPAEYSVEIGPSIFWQGAGLLAPGRGSKDQKGMGAFPALYMCSTIYVLNQVIQPAGKVLAGPANAVSGTPLPLTTTYSLGIGPGAPFGGVNGVAIEPGMAIGGVTSGSSNVSLQAADGWRFSPGMFISIAGGGPSGAMLMTQVITAGTNAITVNPPPSTTQANAAIGLFQGDPSKYGFTLPVNYGPSMNGGAGRFLLPDCACARGVGVTGVAGGTGGPVLIQGLDIFMRPQSEIIIAAAGAGTTYGKKTYKMVLAAIPQFSNAANYSVVTSDLIGLPLSVLPNEPQPVITEAGAAYEGAVTQLADLTNPATTSTGDPRGGFQLSAAGPNSGATGTGPDGASRFLIVMTLNPAQVLGANQFNPGTLFGVAPV